MDLADFGTKYRDSGTTTARVVTAAVSGVAVVDVGGAQLNMQVIRGLTPAVNDIVLVARQGSYRQIIAILFTAAPAPPVTGSTDTPDTPVPVTRTGTKVFAPNFTGTYRASKWRTDTDNVVQGQYAYSSYGVNHGAAFYGNGPSSLKGATCTRITIKLRRVRAGDYGGRTPTLKLITQKTKPAGSPTYGSSTSGPSMAVDTTSTFTLPTSWGQALIDGTSGGIGVDIGGSSSPYIVMNGRSSYSSAFVLSISWRRTT